VTNGAGLRCRAREPKEAIMGRLVRFILAILLLSTSRSFPPLAMMCPPT